MTYPSPTPFLQCRDIVRISPRVLTLRRRMGPKGGYRLQNQTFVIDLLLIEPKPCHIMPLFVALINLKIPRRDMDNFSISPFTFTVVRIRLKLKCSFRWSAWLCLLLRTTLLIWLRKTPLPPVPGLNNSRMCTHGKSKPSKRSNKNR